MTNEEAWQTLCHPLPPRNYRSARRRAFAGRLVIWICVLGVVGGALAMVN